MTAGRPPARVGDAGGDEAEGGMKNILFLSHTVNPFNERKLDSAFAEATRRGWAVHSAEFGWTAWNIADIVAALNPDGIIFEGGRLPGHVDLRPLRGFPTVFVDTDLPEPPGCVTIRSDARAIADLAAAELLASEPAEAAFFSVTPKKTWSRRRCARFRERMRKAKVPFRVLKRAEDVAQLRKPAAVFAVNDMSAAALLRSARHLGFDCPGDFTLVSVDNETLFCENAKPKVTSVEQDPAGTGAAAVKALDWLFRRRANIPAEILIPPRRIVRRSSSFRPQGQMTVAQKVAACIEVRAIEGISVADIARLLGYSRRTVETYYRAAYGRSVGEAILCRRFAEVERLLANPYQQLGAIANMCGWKSSTHLARAFRARYGATMSAWRAARAGRAPAV